ncbi:MAG: YdeI/OmpD-associated family protein [Acidobacteriales bacterium]|nr:YdeI/OmpD-associated family protein [Terriglobales bacterium]
MGKKDKRIGAYIAKSAPFAHPILKHVRKLVHQACPDVEETLKWSAPTFMYKGMLCGMAAFKQHAAFGFWKGSLILDKAGKPVEQSMGNFGRLTSLSDLPPDKTLIGYIKKAMELNDSGVRSPARAKTKEKKPLVVPPYLKAALQKNKKAQATFEGFSYTNKKEYVEWLTDAKQEETRDRRLAQALEWMAEGKIRNWKYANC